MEKQDIDKILMVISASKGVVSVGEKIFANGKIDWADSVHVPPLYKEIEKMVEAFKNYKELGLEIKDLDGAEAIQIVTELFA